MKDKLSDYGVSGDDNSKEYANEGNTQLNIVWNPSPLIRWKIIHIDTIRYTKILQQLWSCSNGEQEWRDVPEEN